MKLSRNNLQNISTDNGLILPDSNVFSLPEKVLQFGTGGFVRGLIDFLIDKANNQGEFNGRVVMVKSTTVGDIGTFKNQDNLYTLIMKSIDEGVQKEEKVVCAAISRVINAIEDWQQVLMCAANEELKIIISNTTEVGIVMVDNDSITSKPPLSFPAKLLSFLYERYKIFNGSSESGMVIVPTELIPDNATKLKEILNRLALQNALEDDFIKWLNESNDFCNSLVDRIVPGKLPIAEQLKVQNELGYEDDLMIMSETFGLWAIETANPGTRDLLSFSKVYSGVYIVPNIDKFRELKLRLLNGSHNLSCAIGFIAGFNTVKEAMANPVFDRFMQKMINDDIAKAIISESITIEEAREFGSKVLDRYRNPYIEFEWLSIMKNTILFRIAYL
jgi:tagaturonate reductase